MERVYTDYTASGRQVVLNNVPTSFANITIENIRLIFNETQKNAKGKALDPLVSTGVKENATSVTYDGTANTVTILLAENVPAIVGTDELTIKVDMGESVDDIDTSSLSKQGDNPAATNSAILEALSHINPQDPNSKALAEFFGVTLLQGYEFMTDTEATDELEDIMQALDPELLQEVEYPEGSGTYMTKAQAITAEAMQIINDDEEQS